MSDDYNKPHFLRHRETPQQILKKETIKPGKAHRTNPYIPEIPVYVVRDHPGNNDDRASSTVVEQEAIKPANEILPNKGEKR